MSPREIAKLIKQNRRVPRVEERPEAQASIVQSKDDDDDLLNTQEVADWIGMSAQWIADQRCKGLGPPYVKYGARSIKYRKGDIRRWLKSKTLNDINDDQQGAGR